MSQKYHSFKNSYIIIEDISQKHQPFYKEYTSKVPNLNLCSKPLACPFTTKKFTKGAKQAKNGYCEVCYVKYDDYQQHFIETEHREFARVDAHYKEVDAIIYELESEDDFDIERPLSPLVKANQRMSLESYETGDGTKESINTIVFSRVSDKSEGVVVEVEDLNVFIDELFSE